MEEKMNKEKMTDEEITEVIEKILKEQDYMCTYSLATNVQKKLYKQA